jgi:hypothetical protein
MEWLLVCNYKIITCKYAPNVISTEAFTTPRDFNLTAPGKTDAYNVFTDDVNSN